MSDNNSTPLKKIKSSLFERTLSVAKIGINAGLKYAAHKASGGDLDQFLNSQALTITKELGQLKGSLMKAGQMLSMYGEYFLPPAANEMLKKLQNDSPALDWSIVKTYLEESLDAELIDELEIDPRALGTASMGQVHKAIIKKTKEVIVLKIQYPRLEEAIDSDVRALKSLLTLSKLIPSEIDLDPVLEEIKSMLRQELDYTVEADLTEKYASLLQSDHRYAVPKVYRRYSNKKVLATQFMEGFKADHTLVQGLSQERLNRLSENFIDLYFREIFEWNFVQTDPHLGNYKIQIDPQGLDRLVLLDFGATREFPADFISAYKKLIKGSIIRNKEMFFSGARELGFIIDKDTPEYIDAFETFCSETVEPFWTHDDPRNKLGHILPDGTYDWKKNDLPSRVVKKAIQFKNFDLRTPPKDILFLDRKTGGVFIFLSVLRAKINARKQVNKYLDYVTLHK